MIELGKSCALLNAAEMDHLCLHICICHTLTAGERNQRSCDKMHRVTEAEVATDSGHVMAWFITQLAEDQRKMEVLKYHPENSLHFCPTQPKP